MESGKPLARFPLIFTKHTEEAEAAITGSLTDVSIERVAYSNRFFLEMNAVNFRRTSLVFNRFNAETKIKAGLFDDPALFVIGGSVPAKFILNKGSVVVSSHKAAMITPAKQMQIERSEGSEILVLKTSFTDLLHQFSKLTGRHHKGSLIFDHSIDLTKGPGAILKRMINYLVYELEHNESAMNMPDLLRSYDQMLLTALLFLPHSQREKLNEDRHHQVAPKLVNRAEEYMRAHLTESISIADLLGICDCNRSMLFAAFRNARGYTPMEFLTEQRLQSAREKLLKARPTSSVSSVALDCGFTNFGRFSQVYKRRFGERPSDTLYNGREH